MRVKELKSLLNEMPDEALIIMHYDQDDSFLSGLYSVKACDYKEENRGGSVFERNRELDLNQTVVVLKGKAGLDNINEYKTNTQLKNPINSVYYYGRRIKHG